MELKPGYKQTEAGVIPEDWQSQPLSEGVKLFSGQHVLAKDSNTEGRGVAYITGPADFPGGVIEISKFTEKPTTICREGDILVTVKGSGAGTIVLSNGEYCISRQLMALRVNSWNPSFVYATLRRNSSLLGAAATGLIPGLTRSDILNKFVPIPQLPEQRAIAAALSDTDALLSSLDRLLAKKRDIKQAVMQQLLMGKQRLPGFSGEWEVKRLGKLARITKGQQLNRAELSLADEFPAWNGGMEPSGFTDIWNTLENTITISEGGNSCGFVGFVKQKFWCGGHCYALLDVSTELDRTFLYFLLKCKQSLIMSLRMGSGLPNIQRKYLSELPLSYPTLSEQAAIAAVLSDIDAEIDALQQRRDKTRALKQGMMQELLTGRTRLV